MSLQSNALTTRQRVIDFGELGTLSTTEGTVLDSIINATSKWVENYCARTFKQTTHTNEEHDGDETPTLMARHLPITSFTKLEERTGSSSWNTIPSSDYVVEEETGLIRIDNVDSWRNVMTTHGRFAKGFVNYRITYVAGYAFDNTAATPITLESVGLGDLEYAVWKLCIAAWNKRKGGSDIQSERLGDYSVTYRKETLESEEIKDILDRHALFNEEF